MDEQIKFRVYYPSTNYMDYNPCLLYLNGKFEVRVIVKNKENQFCPYLVPETPIIMRSISFKDKDDSEIFYGDILYDDSIKMKISTSDLHIGYWIREEDKMNNPMNSIKIIGNIHQNPGLLDND